LDIALKCELLNRHSQRISGIKSLIQKYEHGLEFKLDSELEDTYRQKAVSTVYAYNMLSEKGLHVNVSSPTKNELMPFKSFLEMIRTHGYEHPDIKWWPPNFGSYDEYKDHVHSFVTQLSNQTIEA
jgi:hypothetical protein